MSRPSLLYAAWLVAGFSLGVFAMSYYQYREAHTYSDEDLPRMRGVHQTIG